MARAIVKQSRPVAASLIDLRERIDEINLKLVNLLSERARIAQEIGHLKQADGDEIYQPARERDGSSIARLLTIRGRLPQTIFSPNSSSRLSRPARHSSGRFAWPTWDQNIHTAMRRCVAASAPARLSSRNRRSRRSSRRSTTSGPITEWFRSKTRPEGSVGLTLDLLIDTPMVIIGEILLPIRHAIMSRDGQPAKIEKIVSHQQSLGQCRNYLAANYPHCELEAVSSNSFAAKLASKNPSAAAICSAGAAKPYDLLIIAENIQDVAQNTTRFLVLGRQPVARSGADKTSLLFALPERAGALHGALSLFAREKINLTMIQSRPQRERPWAYIFFVDLQGHREDARVRRALRAVERQALFLKVLGSYPEGRSAGS